MFDDIPKGLWTRVSIRPDSPELDVLRLPDDWRADQTREPNQCCTICHWNGCWDQILDFSGSRNVGLEGKILLQSLQTSASAGNICCAILFALSRKFRLYEYESEWLELDSVWLRPDVMNRKNPEYIRGVYISCHVSASLAPPGPIVCPNGGHLSVDTRSEESLDWAKRRIEECVRNHKCDAFQSKEPNLPTRLVYIPEDAQKSGVRLIPDSSILSKCTQYAALSHCWGNIEPPCLTTIDNIDRHSNEGIPWEIIPPTFRDAMLCTRSLGLEYIWIDSMCIIQKKKGQKDHEDQKDQENCEDWKLESTKMFEYYSNAYVTLASTFSTDCNGGFFSKQHINAARLRLLDVEFRGQRYPVYAFCDLSIGSITVNYFEDGNVDLGNSFQLFNRAWIYQERLVSPRILYFSENQLIFECYGERWFQQTGDHTKDTRKCRYGLSLTNTTDESAERSWVDLLGAFGALQITYATDKLPAIAAVAKQVLSCRQFLHGPEHEYLCGLRKSHLHVDLSWKPIHSSFDKLFGPKCPESYLAPSWSWASIAGKTTYREVLLCEGEKKSTITLKEDHLIFEGDDRFGQVIGGYITVEGAAFECIWHGHFDEEFVGLAIKLTLPGGDQSRDVDFFLDFANVHPKLEDHVENGETVKKVTLLQTWTSADGNIIGFLVLYKNRWNGRYRRLGAGIYDSELDAAFAGDWVRLKVLCEEAECRRLELE